MLERALAGFLALAEMAAPAVLEADRTPAAREAELVTELGEDGDRLLGDLDRILVVRGVDHAAHRRLLEQRIPLLALVARSRRRRDDAVQERLRARDLTERPEREPELTGEVEPRRLLVGCERDRAVEEVHCRRRVITCECAPAGSPEDLGRAP